MAKLLNITSDVDGLSIGSDISAESGIVKSSLPLSLLCGRHITSGITTQLMGTMAGSDFWRLAGGATASDSGFLEIATADNGSEPIYVRQYTGKFTGNSRTLTLLDANGNTETPGNITAKNKGGGDISFTFDRNHNANWKILNTGGNLIFQTDYNTEKTNYFDVLTLNYNSGNATLKGALTVNTGGTLKGNYKISPVASSWINGIKNNVTSAPTFWHTTQNTSSYFPFLGTKCANGDFLSFGTINNQIGFYYCKAARTDNANDGGIWYDTGNGTFYVNGVAGGVACSTAAPSGGFRGELWIQY